jgi:hypothetical protein
MKIKYETVNPLDLSLDFNNPRYLKELHDEEEMRLYLIEYEDSLSIADSINKHGLLPGDSIICVPEGNNIVVIEGNRRVSIMQMLLNRSLIPEKYVQKVPKIPDGNLDEIKSLQIQIIENRELAFPVMANRHIAGIKEWKPLAKKKFFASRFDSGMSLDELSTITNINKSNIAKDISDYKFFIRNYSMYVENNPTFDAEITDLKIDRFIRVFSTNVTSEGESIKAKEYLLMETDEKMEYASTLPDDIFIGFTQHVFCKAFDSKDKDSVNTRSNFDDIPGVEEWKLKIDKFRDEVRPAPEYELLPGNRTITKPEKPDQTGGPGAPKFMGSLYWKGKLSPYNQNHIPLLRIVEELHKMSIGSRGKDYIKYPTAAAILVRSAYEQGLKLLIKITGLWKNFESNHGNPRNQTLSELEKFVETNKHKTLLKDTPLWDSFHNIKKGNYRKFLNDCTHNVEFAYATSDKLEAFAGEGLAGFLQGVIDRAGDDTTK